LHRKLFLSENIIWRLLYGHQSFFTRVPAYDFFGACNLDSSRAERLLVLELAGAAAGMLFFDVAEAFELRL